MGSAATKPVTCPQCGSADTRPSRRSSGISDAIHKAAAQEAWRCRTCRNRFWVGVEQTQPVALPKNDQTTEGAKKRKGHHHHSRRLSARTRKHLLEAALFVGMLIVFYIFLKYIIQERVPAGDSAVRYPVAAETV